MWRVHSKLALLISPSCMMPTWLTKWQNFQWLLKFFNINDACSTNKKSTILCKPWKDDQTIHNVLRILVHTNPPHNISQARDIINDALATAMHAMQTTIANNVGSTPGSLAFAWVMFLKVPLITKWQAITHTCEYHVKWEFTMCQ